MLVAIGEAAIKTLLLLLCLVILMLARAQGGGEAWGGQGKSGRGPEQVPESLTGQCGADRK